MYIYADVVMLVNGSLDFLLLIAANRLAGFPAPWKRLLISAAVGGIYGGFCVIPGFRFLGNLFWRTVFLFLMGIIAFGWSQSAFRRSMLFVLLSMALGGFAIGIGTGGLISVIVSVFCILLLCISGFGSSFCQAEYMPVKLKMKDKIIRITALKDTGNNLRDPVSGERVLIVGSKVAEYLTGLAPAQLKNPIETMLNSKITGLRLIPYHAVGQSGSMMLGMRCEEASIGSWKGSTLIGFAPEGLGDQEEFQALTGGCI